MSLPFNNYISPDNKTPGVPPYTSSPADPESQRSENPPRPAWKQRILDDFTRWLDQLEDVPPKPEDSAPAQPPDLETLLREFTALRQEVRLQSRGNSKVGEQIEKLAEQLSGELESTRTAAASIREDIPRARKESKQRVILEMLDILEGLRRSAAAADSAPLPRLMLRSGTRAKTRQTLAEPLRLLDSKAADCARRLGLEEIAALGRTFDSMTMRAVAATTTGAPANTITEIRRQGYRLDGETIRLAEVCVEKSPAPIQQKHQQTDPAS